MGTSSRVIAREDCGKLAVDKSEAATALHSRLSTDKLGTTSQARVNRLTLAPSMSKVPPINNNHLSHKLGKNVCPAATLQ